MNRSPRLVIFDCDGVLVDSEGLASRILSNALRELGFEADPESLSRELAGLAPVDIVRRLEKHFGTDLPEGFWQDVQRETYRAFDEKLQPVRGAERIAADLKRSGIEICVASSGNREKLGVSLKVTGLYDMFAPNIFSAEEVSGGKPAPDLFLYAAEQMDVAPRDCLVIEDSGPGIEAALAAGMKAVLFDPRGQSNPLRHRVPRITSLEEVAGFLQSGASTS